MISSRTRWVLLFLCVPIFAVWLATLVLMKNEPTPFDIAGVWRATYHEDQIERSEGPAVGAYQGLPINEAARLRADSWNPELLTLPERQCVPYPADQGSSWSGLRISEEVDPITGKLIAYRTVVELMTVERTIYMDGRAHPPNYAPHTWQGFSTGKWEGNVLTVSTTHLKAAWLRRNGVPRSDRAELTEHFIRNGDILTWITAVSDPVYLTEPFVRGGSFVLTSSQSPFALQPCGVQDQIEEAVFPPGFVPHHLPGTNDQLFEHAERFGLSKEATRGGARTMYPEFNQGLEVD